MIGCLCRDEPTGVFFICVCVCVRVCVCACVCLNVGLLLFLLSSVVCPDSTSGTLM